MKVLIVGGSGLIGKALTAHLCLKGHEVTWLGRKVITTENTTIASYDYETFFSQTRDFDAVVNLAGEPISQYWTEKSKFKIRESRISTTHRLTAAIKSGQLQTRVFISGSAIGIYGNGGDISLDECSPVGKGFLAETANLWERESLNDSVRTIQLRTGIVLSNDGGALPIWVKTSQFGLGLIFGSGHQYVPWIHITDMSHLIIHAIENSQLSGPINACSPEPVSMKTLQKAIAKKLSRPQFLYLPKVVSQIALKDLTELLLYSQKALPTKAIESGFQFNYPQLVNALNDLIVPYKKA